MSSLLPISVITGAVTGDPESVNEVIRNYTGYIAFLSSRYGHFDVEASCRMEAQLLQALFKFDLNYT